MFKHFVFSALLVIAAISCASAQDAADTRFNYAEALQKSLYFYEAQQSGQLSPNNRVAWRGPSCLTDGQDIGHDLSGGWFDAGDHWTANLTMSFAAMTLAWSAIEQPQGYLQSNQMDELLESLIHVNRYFVKCVLNPECDDPATQLEVAIGCGGREGVPKPSVHAMWAPAEVAHLMTNRPTFRLNGQTPGGDIPGAMAAAMAASSMVIRDHSEVLKSKPGYEEFDPEAFADLLLDRAEMLVLFARANSGPVVDKKQPQAEQDLIRKRRREALRSDGELVEIGYRADPFDKVFTAATFLQRAHLAKDAKAGNKWFDFANEIYEKEYKAEFNHDWWKDFGAGNFGKLGAYNMMILAPHEQKFHEELQMYCCRFCGYDPTPGGLRLREHNAHAYGSLRHSNNAAVITLYYSDHVLQAPPIEGNTWWKAGKTNEQLRQMFIREGRRPVDYALGANPYGRSYVVGFGNRPFNHVHHRGAFGAWAGFLHLIPEKPEYRETARHVLYGAMVAGPDNNDVFLCGEKIRPWMEVAGTSEQDFCYKFPNRDQPIRKSGYKFDPADQPVQDVMDSKFNEVALDYNAGFTASLAWLTAHGFSDGKSLSDTEFPPKDERNENTDLLTTDREYFVAARHLDSGTNGITLEATLFNRSRWPSVAGDNFSFRYYLTPDGNSRLSDIEATVTPSDGKAVAAVDEDANGNGYVEVGFPNETLYPGDADRKTDRRTVTLKITGPQWNNKNDWSHQGVQADLTLLPSIPVFSGGQLVGGLSP